MGHIRWIVCAAVLLTLLTGCSGKQSVGTQIAFEKPVDTSLVSTSEGFYTLTTSELFDYKKEFIFSGDSLTEIKEVFEPHEGFDISEISEYTDGDFAPTDLVMREDGSYYCITTFGGDFEALSSMTRQQLYKQFEAALET